MKRKDSKHNQGIQLLVKKYRDMFQIPENLNHYSSENYKIAEKRFIRHALAEHYVSVPK